MTDLIVESDDNIELVVGTQTPVGLEISEAFIEYDAPTYEGSYSVTPSAAQQVLETDGLLMTDDVTVAAVPEGTLGVPVISVMTVLGAPTINARCEVENGGFLETGEYTAKGVTPASILPTQAGTTITPTTSEQTAVDTHKWTTGAVKVAAIPPEYVVPTGTKTISANGTGIDVKAYEKVNVNVPNSYAAGDEGKVVSNGALVSQTSDTVTANDTYDTTLINSLTVNVSGGGGGTTVIMTSTASNVVACGTQIFGTLSANKMYHASLVEKAQSDWIQDQLLIIMKIGASSSSASGDAIRWRDNNYSDAPYANNWAANVAIGDKYEVFETEY